MIQSKEIMPYILKMEPLIDKLVSLLDLFQSVDVSSIANYQSINMLAVDGFLSADALKSIYSQMYETATKDRDLKATA